MCVYACVYACVCVCVSACAYNKSVISSNESLWFLFHFQRINSKVYYNQYTYLHIKVLFWTIKRKLLVIIFLFLRVFSPWAPTDGFSLKIEWPQVSSDHQNSSEYPNSF